MGQQAYYAISAKLRGMKRKLLQPDELETLMSLTSVMEMTAFLKQQSAYSRLLAGINEADTHRDELERIFLQSVFDDFTKLYRFANLEQREFLNFYLIKYEIRLLKNYLRKILDPDLQKINVEPYADFFYRHSHLDLNSLENVHSLDEFAILLKDSMYFKPISRLAKLAAPTLFDYEMALDSFYFDYIIKHRSRLRTAVERKGFHKSYGTSFDVLNLLYIYRSKVYYRVPAANVYLMLIPAQYHLTKEELTAMVEAADEDAFWQIFRKTYYGKYLTNGKTSLNLEKLYGTLLSATISKLGHIHSFTTLGLHAYLYAKDTEMHTLTTILEGLRYHLDANEIRSLVSATNLPGGSKS
ncbi:MAG: V-type ATPase subunit [Lachnospiraceae bacterium]|nr:V-type ATPase subunit [Lachnospiraceae bacterium]MDY5742367.1 V-type ATPase subunit [Lachnospiraceae bacterium]